MDAVAVNLFSVKIHRPEHFRGSRGQATGLTACLSAGFASAWRSEPRDIHPSSQSATRPRRAGRPERAKTGGQNCRPTTHVHVPRDATRASASQGRFQNLTALWFTRAAAGRHMSQAASGRRGFVLPGRERDGGIGGFCFSARTLHRRCTVPRSTNLACTARSRSYSRCARCQPKWHAATTPPNAAHPQLDTRHHDNSRMMYTDTSSRPPPRAIWRRRRRRPPRAYATGRRARRRRPRPRTAAWRGRRRTARTGRARPAPAGT